MHQLFLDHRSFGTLLQKQTKKHSKAVPFPTAETQIIILFEAEISFHAWSYNMPGEFQTASAFHIKLVQGATALKVPAFTLAGGEGSWERDSAILALIQLLPTTHMAQRIDFQLSFLNQRYME